MTEDRVLALKEHIFAELQKDDAWAEETLKSFGDLAYQSPLSLRLRHFGFQVLKHYYDHQTFELEERLTGKELLTLRDSVGYPYFLPVNHSHISLFTVKQSFVLKLNGGDVKKWLKNLGNKDS